MPRMRSNKPISLVDQSQQFNLAQPPFKFSLPLTVGGSLDVTGQRDALYKASPRNSLPHHG